MELLPRWMDVALPLEEPDGEADGAACARRSERRRCLGLWLCLATFTLRVLGQAEVLLLQPSFLPPLRAWDSGLIPYPLLLPLQVLLIAWLAVIAADHTRGSGTFWVSDPRRARALRVFAALYAAVTLCRLLATLALAPHTLLDRGLIPIVAHWDLAAFAALLGMTPRSHTAPGRALSPQAAEGFRS
jgi:hypothetical protein